MIKTGGISIPSTNPRERAGLLPWAIRRHAGHGRRARALTCYPQRFADHDSNKRHEADRHGQSVPDQP